MINNMPRMAIIVPSRGRPKQMAALTQVTSTWVDWYVCCDLDDPKVFEYSALLAETADNVEFEAGNPKRLVPWLNEISAKLVDHYEVIGFMGDDHMPITPHWDGRIVDRLWKMQHGIVYCNDLFQGENLPTAAFLTSSIIKALGYMAPPTLTHMYVDNFWLDLGRRIRKIAYLDDVIIEHTHPAAGKGTMDDGYTTANAYLQIDKEAYQRYKLDDFDDAAERVMEAIGQHDKANAKA